MIVLVSTGMETENNFDGWESEGMENEENPGVDQKKGGGLNGGDPFMGSGGQQGAGQCLWDCGRLPAWLSMH